MHTEIRIDISNSIQFIDHLYSLIESPLREGFVQLSQNYKQVNMRNLEMPQNGH